MIVNYMLILTFYDNVNKYKSCTPVSYSKERHLLVVSKELPSTPGKSMITFISKAIRKVDSDMKDVITVITVIIGWSILIIGCQMRFYFH